MENELVLGLHWGGVGARVCCAGLGRTEVARVTNKISVSSALRFQA